MPSEIPTTALRCIFCGGDNIKVDKFTHETFAVSCEADDCQAIGPDRMTREDAIDAWYAPERRKP